MDFLILMELLDFFINPAFLVLGTHQKRLHRFQGGNELRNIGGRTKKYPIRGGSD